MGGWEIAIVIALFVISTAAAVLFANKGGQGADSDQQRSAFDNKETTVARRGTYLPVVMGRNRINATVLAAGNRFIRQEEVGETVTGGGGGGKGGGGEEPETEPVFQDVYFEDIWHGLCLGPLDRLAFVRLDGKNILESSISRPESGLVRPVATGAQFTVTYEAFPSIYWGNCEQPHPGTGLPYSPGVASLLQGTGNPLSAFPWLAFIYWSQFRLGSQPLWPQIDYEVEWRIKDTPLTLSSPWMDPSEVGLKDAGVNPAHAVVWLLTSPPPWGAGIPTSDLNLDSFEALGQLFQQEHIPVNFVIKNGEELSGVLAKVQQDCGFLMSQKGSQIYAVPIREEDDPESLPFFGDEVIIGSQPEQTIDLNSQGGTRLDFEFRGQNVKLRNQDYILEDDSLSTQGLTYRKIQKVQLPTITDLRTAAKVADRRASEELTDKEIVTISLLHGGHQLLHGQACRVEGLEGVWRVATIQLNMQDDKAKVDLVKDHFGAPIADFQLGDDDLFNPIFEDNAEEDAYFDFFEIPFFYVGPVIRFFVGRFRGNPTISGATVNMSADDVTYNNVGVDRSNMMGGFLLQDLPELTETVIDEASEIDSLLIVTPDKFNVQDLTGNDIAHFAGQQIVIMKDEVMFCRQVEAISGPTIPSESGDFIDATVFRLNGLIRARAGTNAIEHLTGEAVFITSPSALNTYTFIAATIGVDVWLKTGPFTGAQQVDISTVSPVMKTIVGRALRPYDLGHFHVRAIAGQPQARNRYVANEDMEFDWSYRKLIGQPITAGTQAAGVPVPTTVVGADGGLRIEFRTAAGTLPNALVSTYDGVSFSDTSAATIILTKDQVGVESLTVPNAFVQNVFGGQPTSFIIRTYQQLEVEVGTSALESLGIDTVVFEYDQPSS